MSKTKYYLTTASYDGGSGHQIESLYTAIACDAIARHKGMCGFDVACFVGADPRNGPLESPLESSSAERTAAMGRNLQTKILDLVNVHGSVHTSAADHALAVENLLRRTMRRSRWAIYTDQYQGRFCPDDQIDVSDSAEKADCRVCGRPTILISEERHFFRLSAFRDRLTALYKYRLEFIQPQFRLDEIRTLVARDLKDILVSCRPVPGGIPWPDHADRTVSGSFSRLAAYVSCLGFGREGHEGDAFKRFWPANVHVVGNDALWSHTVLWPALLMAADLPVPRHVFIHGDLHDHQPRSSEPFLSESVVQTFGSDAIRYYLLRQFGYQGDADVSGPDLARRCKTDLVDGLEKLANKVLMLVGRYSDGRIPNRSVLCLDHGLEITSAHIKAEVRLLFDSYRISEAIEKIWSLARAVDKLLIENNPAELADDPRENRRLKDTLNDACEGLGLITLLLHPFLPRSTEAIWKGLGQSTRLEDQSIDDSPWGCLTPGTPVRTPKRLFPEAGGFHSPT